jgi:hypothetical protein
MYLLKDMLHLPFSTLLGVDVNFIVVGGHGKLCKFQRGEGRGYT